MRLIDTETLEIHEFLDADNAPEYAILSHCWGEDEVSFKEFTKKKNIDGSGYKKIVECCAYAKSRQREWVWIDTCYIDKRSSSELSKAINSMYEWYRKSEECYAYLHDVAIINAHTATASSEFYNSRWFRRGWTLQELIAPRRIIFLARSWGEIEYNMISQNDHVFESDDPSYRPLTSVVAKVTGIPRSLLASAYSKLAGYSAGERLMWMAARQTSRKEDIAYCLLGLFDLNLSLQYGEGTKAFQRLLKEILNKTGDE